MSAIVIISLIGWLLGFAVLWRIPICDDSTPAQALSLSIIIPARDEERSLPTLLQSINSQKFRPAEVIVVDDDSKDRTAVLAGGLGATVLKSLPLPEGWRGKTWACHQGALAAKGAHLLFLDADTRFESGGLQRIVNAYNVFGGVLSVAPYHMVFAPYEQLSGYFNLIMTAGIGAFAFVDRQPDGLFGQMLMIEKETYIKVGGHERVKGKVLENLWLARHIRDAGVRIRCMAGKSSLAFRMYPNGLKELIAGWSKSFASGAGATARPVLFAIIVWLSGSVMAAAALIQHPGLVSGCIYSLYAIQLFLFLYRIGSFSWYVAVLYPLALLFFFAIFGRSILFSHRTVTWKGRAVHAD